MVKKKYLLLIIAGLVVLVLIVALAIYKHSPKIEEIRAAKIAIQSAKEAGAEEYAPQRIKIARNNLLKAQKSRKKEEAKSLALQAKGDAEIAEFLAKRAQKLKEKAK